MLTEIKNIRQIPGDPFRRWFHSSDMDLTVWYAEDQSIQGFQLCYDKLKQEKAITWKKPDFFMHQLVDDGEHMDYSYKATPILTTDENVDKGYLLNRFLEESAELEPDICSIIRDVVSAL